jgi:vancomycin aglycone glucosyltransferase
VRAAGEEFAALLARVGVPLVPLGPSVRSVVSGTKPPTAKDALWLAPELVAARFDTLTTAAPGCDALPAVDLMPAGAGRRPTSLVVQDGWWAC